MPDSLHIKTLVSYVRNVVSSIPILENRYATAKLDRFRFACPHATVGGTG
jgi:hypothetical protein